MGGGGGLGQVHVHKISCLKVDQWNCVEADLSLIPSENRQ